MLGGGGGAYIALNTKVINVPDSTKAVLWCGGNAGLVGYKPELAKRSGRSWGFFNGETLRTHKQEIMDGIVLEMADNPFKEFGISLASSYFDAIATGFDSAIRQECSGETNAYLDFIEKVGRTADLEPASTSQEPDDTQAEPDDQETASDYPPPDDAPTEEEPDYFSCVVLSEPTFLEDNIIFTATNNCVTTIDSISWDVNILTTDLSLVDTSTATFSDLRVGETKQDEVYIDVPAGEFNWKTIPGSAYAF